MGLYLMETNSTGSSHMENISTLAQLLHQNKKEEIFSF